MLIAPPVDVEPIYDPNPLRNALLAAGVAVICVALPYLIFGRILHGN